MRNQVLVYAMIGMMAFACKDVAGGAKLYEMSVLQSSTQEMVVHKVSLPMKVENITEVKLVGKEKVANDKDTIKSLVRLLENVDVKEVNPDDYQTIYGFTALEFKDKSGNKMTVSLQGEYISVDDKVYAIDETEDEMSDIYDEIYGLFNLERR